MRGIGRGFTIVEVSIFLAVTGLLFIGITIGVQNSIFQQRYNDAVQGFADFLRNAYSNVLNVQSLGRGDSDLAIYGKMLVFGDEESGGQKIRMYSVVGKADIDSSECGTSLFKVLVCGNASIVRGEGDQAEFAGVIEEYKPRWGTKIQKAGGDGGLLSDPEDYEGVVLIVRDPVSGRVHTAVSDNSEPPRVDIADPNNAADILSTRLKLDGKNGGFVSKQVDFCVNPNGDEPSNRRVDVRIITGASNASGVEIVTDGDNSNKCR